MREENRSGEARETGTLTSNTTKKPEHRGSSLVQLPLKTFVAEMRLGILGLIKPSNYSKC